MSLPVLNEALAAYRAGYMPIPLRTDQGNRKRPAIPSWRQYQHQRPDEDTIREWFADGEANLGIITGKVSGLVVLDLDGRIADPRAWLAGHGFNVNTPIVATGGGGVHVYYRHPGGVVPNGVKLREIDGVALDIRADGGYVVAPPSMHDTGALSDWIVGLDQPPAPFPQELLSLPNRATEHGTLKVSDVLDGDGDELLRSAPKGQRNHRAAKVAGYFLKVMHGDEHAAWQATNLWNYQNDPPLATSELRRTFESIARRDRVVRVELDSETEDAGGDPLPLMDGQAWAESVRDQPPRQGTPATSIPPRCGRCGEPATASMPRSGPIRATAPCSWKCCASRTGRPTPCGA